MLSLKQHRNILTEIRNKLQYENFYWEVGYVALVLAGVVHVGFLLLFLFLKLYLLAALNVVSVFIYWYCIFGIGLKTLERKDDGLIGWLVYAELIGHNVIATYCLGADAGFQYYIYLLAIVPFFISTYSMPVYLFRVVTALSIAIYLDVSEQFHHGKLLSEGIVTEWMYGMNLVISVGALVLLFSLYLIKEKRHHNKLLEKDEPSKEVPQDGKCKKNK